MRIILLYVFAKSLQCLTSVKTLGAPSFCSIQPVKISCHKASRKLHCAPLIKRVGNRKLCARVVLKFALTVNPLIGFQGPTVDSGQHP